MTRILDLSEKSSELTQIRDKIMDYQPIKDILANQKENTYWINQLKDSNYKKYLGTFWQIHFLRTLQAERCEQIENAIEHIFTTGQTPNGGFSITGTNYGAIHCLTSNMVRALVHFGYLRDDRTQKALRYLVDGIINTSGAICLGTIGLLRSCYMALPKAIFALASIPAEEQTTEIKESLIICSRILLENNIFKYLPKDTKEWFRIYAEKKLAGKEIANEREKFLAQHPIKEKVAKEGWTKFSFPLSYNSDTLDAMLALAEAKVQYTNKMKEAIDLIKTKNVNGKWINESSLKSPMYTLIEENKKESKWLTLNALVVLKHYEGLEII